MHMANTKGQAHATVFAGEWFSNLLMYGYHPYVNLVHRLSYADLLGFSVM